MKTTMHLFKIAPLFFLLQLWLPAAQAHAFIDHSQPKAGEELDAPPQAIILTFDKSIEPAFSSIKIAREESQTAIETGPAQGVEGDSDKLILPLPELSPGEYHVNWVVLARDGHRTMGDYTFVIK